MSDSQQIVMVNGQVVNETLTDSQKLWLEQIGYYQATIITSQPTQWDNTLSSASLETLTTQSDQTSEKIAALQR